MRELCRVVCYLVLLSPASAYPLTLCDTGSEGPFPVPTWDGRPVLAVSDRGEGASLGVWFGDVTPEQAYLAGLDKPRGAYVSAVLPGGPAALAGLEIDDIILEVNREEITGGTTLATIVRSAAPGESVHLKILRERRAVELDVVLVASPPDASARQDAAFRSCAVRACPACEQTIMFLGFPPGDACRACVKSLGREIAACSTARLDSDGPAPARAPAPPPAAQSALALNGVWLKPSTVAPGGRFSIEISYAASSTGSLTFAFSISAEGRELFASAPEAIDTGGGARMLYSRTLEAAANPGAYRIRVRLQQADEAVEGTAVLTITPRRP